MDDSEGEIKLVPNDTYLKLCSGRTEFMSASASLEWAVECGDCFKRARHKIRRYPECTEDIEELLKGEVLC